MTGIIENARDAVRKATDAVAIKDADNWYNVFQQRLSNVPNNMNFASTKPEAIVRDNVKRKIASSGLVWPTNEGLQNWVIMKVLMKSAVSGGGSTIPASHVWDPVVVGDAIEGFGPFKFGTLQDELVVPEEVRAKLSQSLNSTN